MSTESDVEAAVGLALPLVIDLAEDIQSGKIKTVLQFVERLVGIGEKVVPDGDLAPYLTHGGKVTAELAADLAEDVKFGDDDGNTG